MTSKTIYGYRNVFSRDFSTEFTFDDFINNPEKILNHYDLDVAELERIKNIEDKAERNNEKRNLIPAVDISSASVLSIDIDGIHNNPALKSIIIDKLKRLDLTYAVKESVSGNVVAFFKYDCNSSDFKFLYYKLYLELTLMLSVNIDFLPEIGRLRYVSLGETYYINEDSKVVTEMLVVDQLPYINTVVKKDKARGIIYGSN